MLPGRAPGLHLSDEGRKQAKDVVSNLAGVEKIDLIFSSPMERAQETAAPLAENRQIQVELDDRLLECDFGTFTGRRLDELSKLADWKIIQGAPSRYTFPEGEGFISMSNRMIDFMSWCHAFHNGKTIVAFSHADPIKALMAHCLGIHLDNFQRVIISTCGISAIAIGDASNYALYVNSTTTPNLKVS